MAVDFQPVFIRSEEYEQFGLPNMEEVPTIDRLVMEASTMIDEYCGRKNSDGIGSLIYTTYTERRMIVGGYNVARLSQRPLVGLTASLATTLSISGADQPGYYTGFTPNTVSSMNLNLNPLISASGRYGYGRRSDIRRQPDYGMGINPLTISLPAGGPPMWIAIAVEGIDVDPQTGECWFPAGLYLAQFTEIAVTYNSGYDPRYLPPAIKNACGMLVRNFLARAGNTTGVTSIGGVGRISTVFSENVIDGNMQDLLKAYRTVIAM